MLKKQNSNTPERNNKEAKKVNEFFTTTRHPNSEIQVADIMPTEYISVIEALKLVSPFSGNKKEVLTLVYNVHTAFECISPENGQIVSVCANKNKCQTQNHITQK
jgi:hypothetical protein